jgi:chitodextrinase
MGVRSLAAVGSATAAFVLAFTVGVAPAMAAPPRGTAPPRDTTPPTMPTNFRATEVTQTSVTFSWSPSTDNVRVVEYAVWTLGVPIVRVPHPQTTATVTSLRPNTSYLFRVQAWDGWNWSWQAELTVTTQRELVAPSAPSGLHLSDVSWGQPVDGVTASKVLLAWNSSTDNWGPITYEVLVDGVPTPNAASTRPAGTPSGPTAGAWVRQLRPGTTYQLAVRARDASGNVSAPSNTVIVTTDQSTDVTAPTTPTLLSAGIGAAGYCPDEIWLRWSASTDDVESPSAIEYEIRVNGIINEVAVGATRWVAYTEVHGPNTVTIVAVDSAGNASGPSNAITGSTNWGVGADCPG